MQVHNLKPEKKKKDKKRIGRGGSRGSFSGKGTKGQKKRAGATTPSYEERLIKKFPKLRGVKNKKVAPNTEVINVGNLENHFSDGDKVSKESLIKKGVISKKASAVKILGDGNISISLEISNLPMSNSAKKKIEKAGGEII